MKTLACLGDSNTFGFDPTSLWGGPYPEGIPWPDRLAAAGYTVHNLGQNGLGVSRDLLHPVFVREIRSLGRIDLLTVMLGSNDLLLGLSAEETSAHMKKLLSLLQAEKAADKILLLAPVPFRRGVWVSDDHLIRSSRLLSEQYGTLAEALRTGFADTGGWDIPLACDGVHFTEGGHRRFAEALLPLLSGSV